MKGRAYNRIMSKRKAKRKMRLAAELYPCGKTIPYYPHEHMFDKGKIHCSCPSCSPKTATHGYTHSDLKKLEKFKEDWTKDFI